MEQYDSAIADYTAAIRLAPEASILYNNRGNAWYRKGQLDSAAEDYGDAIRLAPKDPLPYKNRASARSDANDFSGALSDLEEALRLGPDDSRVLNSAAWFLATCEDRSLRNARRAVTLAQRACELTEWENWNPIDTLAGCFAAAGDMENAIRFQRKALEISPVRERAALGDRLTQYLARSGSDSNSATELPQERGAALASDEEDRPANLTESKGNESPANEIVAVGNQGLLDIGGTIYRLPHVIAYQATMFEDDEEPSTVVLPWHEHRLRRSSIH